ncbi:MAG: phosphodiester glycosidase family protein [Clostridia bacterium]|nr:phosphodiester glycosidase family protein [Clostridia bacterium]
MKRWMRAAVGAVAALMLTATAVAASPLDGGDPVLSSGIDNGVTLETSTATVDGEAADFYTVLADGDAYTFEIASLGHKNATLSELVKQKGAGADTVAAINGDHFSFQTGIAMGLAVTDGRLLTSPVEPYDADGYFFHTLGIMEDGSVAVGENPMLTMTFRTADTTLTVDRINRTRETWVGGQVCLFTTDYGASTDTNAAGIEYVLDTGEAVLDPGETITGVVKEVNRDNDAAIEDGTMVLSASLLCFEQIKDIEEGDEFELTVSFEDEDWNDVVFAVGGNRAIVEDGEPLPFEYAPGGFRSTGPRSAIGVREDGTLVMAAVDGRSEKSRGLTANEMAAYMAEDLGCAYAILLDGGGSTAISVKTEDGVHEVINVPSDGAERAVGNAVLLTKKPPEETAGVGGADGVMMWIALGLVAVALAAVVVAAVVLKKPGKNA